MWTYKGFDIFKHDPNSWGLKWECFSPWGRLRADSKASMRELINDNLARKHKTVHRRLRRDMFGEEYIYTHAEPVDSPTGNGWMAGECFLYSSDSRYRMAH